MLKWLVCCTETYELAENWPKELSVQGVDDNKHRLDLGLLYGLSVKIGRYVLLGTQSNQISHLFL